MTDERPPQPVPTAAEFVLGHTRPDPAKEEERARAAAEKREMREAGLRRLIEQQWFRDWLIGFLDELGTYDNPIAASPGGFPDPLATQFYLGRKSAGVQLVDLFDDISPDMVSLMRREARKPPPA